MNQTTCLICQRSGSGWAVRENRRFDGLVKGAKVMNDGTQERLEPKIGLKKWLQTNGYEDDPLLIPSVYLYDETAPGEWCQIFWECSNMEVANRLKLKIRGLSDLSGEYLISRTLSDLTPAEIDHYQKTLIDA